MMVPMVMLAVVVVAGRQIIVALCYGSVGDWAATAQQRMTEDDCFLLALTLVER